MNELFRRGWVLYNPKKKQYFNGFGYGDLDKAFIFATRWMAREEREEDERVFKVLIPTKSIMVIK